MENDNVVVFLLPNNLPAAGVIEFSVYDGTARQVGLVAVELRWGNLDEQKTLDEIEELSREYADVLAWPAQCSELTEASLMLRLTELDNKINQAGHQLNGSVPEVQLFESGDPARRVRVKLEFLQGLCHHHLVYLAFREEMEAKMAEANS